MHQKWTFSAASLKPGGFWDNNEPCLQKQQVLLALSTMDSALPIYLLSTLNCLRKFGGHALYPHD